jgi:ligand-binding sensor domain-containing protein/cbb3-type cytochrome oxidase subunit 3
MKQFASLLSLLMVFLNFSLTAQEYSYKHYTVQDGLVQSQVMVLFQDSKGYVWAGTKGGVSRFDGISFQNFTKKDGLPDNAAQFIEEDKQGRIWFLTPEGLASFDGKSITGYPTSLFRNHRGLIALYESEPGVMTIVYTSKTNQVVFLNFSDGIYNQAFLLFPEKELPFPDCLSIGTYDPADKIFWLASYQYGLFKIQDQKAERIDFEMKSINALRIGSDGKLYLLANDKVFFMQNDLFHELFTNPSPIDHFIFPPFVVDKNGVVFFWNQQVQELQLYDGKEIIREGFRFNQMAALMIDCENNLWIGTETGLYRMISRAFVNFIPEKSGINSMIWSVVEDKNGMIWFSSLEEGLQSYDGKKFNTVQSYETVTKGKHFCFYMGSIVDHNKDILFTTTDFMGLKFDGSSFKKMSDENYIISTLIFYEDQENHDLYAGTNCGLFRMRKDKKTENLGIQPGNGKSRSIVSIVKDKNKRFWLGGFNGISLMINDSIIHLPTKEMPFSEGGNAMLTDSRQNIWIGNSEGLFQYDFDKFNSFDQAELGTMVTSLSLIGDSALLIGSVNGLVIFDLNAYYKNKEVNLTVFGKDDGFQGIEVGQNAILRDSKGYYWIPTSDRVVRFEPGLHKKNTIPPQTYISSVSLLNNKMEWVKLNGEHYNNQELSLLHTEKNLRFEFTGISTTMPDRVQYSHFLEGYDRGWSEPEHDRFAVYTNLPPGKYKLLLKAGNSDGVWTSQPVVFSFRIVPAFYQRTIFWISFILLSSFLLFFLGYLLSSYRKRQRQLALEAENKMTQLQLLTIKNQMDPHFVYNAINSIASAVLKEDKEIAYKFFVKLSNLMRSIMSTGDKLVRSLKEEVDFVHDYLDFQKFRHKDRFDYTINISPEVDLFRIVPKMTIQTFTENALKHGLLHLDNGGKLLISIMSKNENLEIIIEDNGIGREKAKLVSENSIGKGFIILNGYFDYFNRNNSKKISWNIFDLIDDEGNATGTRVIVNIPDDFNFGV